MSTFACPKCQLRISEFMDTKGELAAPVNYYCKNCDVIWETGLKTTSNM